MILTSPLESRKTSMNSSK